MKVHLDIKQLPPFREAVVTFGSFDGVHQGHVALIERMRNLAQNVDGETVVVTFDPHPRQVIYPHDTTLQLLSTKEEKIHLFEALDIDHLVFCPFTVEFSQISADEYITKFIIDKFHPRHIMIGYDHRFGRNRAGNIDFLRSYAPTAGFEVHELEQQMTEQIQISSTKIRNYLNHGDIETANALLGHPYLLSGNVVGGHQIGDKLGYPTANIKIDQPLKLIPPDGIYAVQVIYQQKHYDGMLYIGSRPTVSKSGKRSIEVNIFDFDLDIYGQKLIVELLGYIREDAHFSSLEALQLQLGQDKEAVIDFLQQFRIGATTFATVILNYNGLAHLQQFIPSVKRHTPGRIVVADNGSTDASLSWLQKHHPEIEIVRLNQNFGFAGGYNKALLNVRAEYLILLNSDVEVTAGWLEPMIEYMQSHPLTGACQPKVRAYDQPTTFEYAGAAGGLMDKLGYPFCQGRILSEVEEDLGQYDEAKEVFWATGAAMIVRRDVFFNMGGFDDDFFAHMEEIDLCWRLKRAGYRIMVLPQSVVYHKGGGTLNYSSPRKTYLNFRNGMSLLIKNEKTQRLLWLLPLRIILDLVAGVRFLIVGEQGNARSVARAMGYTIRNFPKTWQKRIKMHKLVRRYAVERDNAASGRYQSSIIWEFFVLGKRKYRELRRFPSGLL